MTGKTQTDPATAKDASDKTEPTAAAVSEQQPAESTMSSTDVTPLTIGEMVEEHLELRRIGKKSKKEMSYLCNFVWFLLHFYCLSFSVPQVSNLPLPKSRFPQINCMKYLHNYFLSRYKLNKLVVRSFLFFFCFF